MIKVGDRKGSGKLVKSGALNMNKKQTYFSGMAKINLKQGSILDLHP